MDGASLTFTEEKTDQVRLSDLPEVTQGPSARIWTPTQVFDSKSGALLKAEGKSVIPSDSTT